MSIRIRRGPDVDRLTVVLDDGEIAWTTDTNKFYVGDGVTLGGVEIGPGSTTGVTSVTATSPVSSSGGTTPDISIAQATALTDGYLSSADWTTFNNKQNALGYTPVPETRNLTINGTTYDLTADRTWTVAAGVSSVSGTSPISSTGGSTPVISVAEAAADDITKGVCTFDSSDFNSLAGLIRLDYANAQSASGTNKGFLTSTDWNTFNNKQNALTNPVTGTGTNNEIAAFNSTGSTITSLTTATYPSLTELSYVKGVTSAIQTQLAAKPSQDTFVLQFYHGGAFSPADNTTYYFAYSGNAIGTVATSVDMNLGYAFKIVGVQLFIAGNTVSGTNENVTLQVRNVTTSTSSSVGTYQTNLGSATVSINFTFTGLNISIGASDFFCLQVDTPTWAINPVGCNHRAQIICERQ